MRFLRLFRGCVPAGADRPNRFVSNHRLTQFSGGQISQAAAQLQRQNLFHVPSLALLERLSDAHDRAQARFMGSAGFAIHDFIGLAKHRATLTVANHDITNKKIAQHRGTDFASEGAAPLPMHVLRTNFNILRFSQRFIHFCDRGEGRRNHHFDGGDVIDFQ